METSIGLVQAALRRGDRASPGLTAEEAVFRTADTLVMETTFGKPQFVFPSVNEVGGQIG